MGRVLCAERLGGIARVATIDDHTPSTGIVTFLDAAGTSTGILFRIMHPVQVMESRVHNAMTLPGYDSPAALKQLRLSVACAREFIRDMIDSDCTRVALTLNERVFAFSFRDRNGRAVDARHGVDPFDAVVAADARLPSRFRETRYPQMQQEIKASQSCLLEWTITGAPRTASIATTTIATRSSDCRT